jgi:hypothetical protein
LTIIEGLRYKEDAPASQHVSFNERPNTTDLYAALDEREEEEENSNRLSKKIEQMELETRLLNIPEVTPERESRSPSESAYPDEFEDHREGQGNFMTFAERSPNEVANFDPRMPNPAAVYNRELAYSQASSQNVEYLRKIYKVQEMNPVKAKFKSLHKVQQFIPISSGANAKRKVINILGDLNI